MNDVAFRHVVDSLQRVIVELQLTPGEVREAAVFACMRVEMRRARNYLVPHELQGAACPACAAELGPDAAIYVHTCEARRGETGVRRR